MCKIKTFKSQQVHCRNQSAIWFINKRSNKSCHNSKLQVTHVKQAWQLLLTRNSTSRLNKSYNEAPFVVISDANCLASFMS